MYNRHVEMINNNKKGEKIKVKCGENMASTHKYGKA